MRPLFRSEQYRSKASEKHAVVESGWKALNAEGTVQIRSSCLFAIGGFWFRMPRHATNVADDSLPRHRSHSIRLRLFDNGSLHNHCNTAWRGQRPGG